MSTTTPELTRRCARCSNELPPGTLACDHCQALVHSQELESLSADAKLLEQRGDFRHAREKWLSALPLLPAASMQADWIKKHLRDLDAADASPERARRNGYEKFQTLGLLGPNVASSSIRPSARGPRSQWTAILSFLVFVAIYSAASGATFGIGFAVLILIHEMGHFIDIKRRGLPADMPIFLPGLGAYVRWQALGVPLETRTAISLAGPLAGLLASVACAAIWWQTGNIIWADLARVSAILNLLNLIPVWVLDGGQAVLALSKTERIVLFAACIAMGLALQETWFILVAAGAGYQAFMTHDFPEHPSRGTTIYYVALLIALGVMIRMLPGQGFGVN